MFVEVVKFNSKPLCALLYKIYLIFITRIGFWQKISSKWKKKSMKSKLGPKLHSQLSTRKIRQTNQEYKLTLSRKKEVLARHNGQKFAIIWSTKIHVAFRIPKMANSAPFSPEHYFEHITSNFWRVKKKISAGGLLVCLVFFLLPSA